MAAGTTPASACQVAKRIQHAVSRSAAGRKLAFCSPHLPSLPLDSPKLQPIPLQVVLARWLARARQVGVGMHMQCWARMDSELHSAHRNLRRSCTCMLEEHFVLTCFLGCAHLGCICHARLQLLEQYNPADMVQSLCRMISYNIGQLAYLNAKR